MKQLYTFAKSNKQEIQKSDMNFSQLNNKAWWWHSGFFCCENLLYT